MYYIWQPNGLILSGDTKNINIQTLFYDSLLAIA